MRSNVAENTGFPDGSKYLKADLHLHTKADKEFKCAISDETNFAEKYVNELKEKGIKIGAITNHNKFEHDEFQLLNAMAIKEDIFLLPGIELSVNDGKRGMHTLIIFAPEDTEKDANDTSKIETFLTFAFGSDPRFDDAGNPTRCNLNLDATIEKLDELKCHYFIILAHASTKCGFFKELEGGRIKDFLKSGYFRKQIVACQDTGESSQSTFLNSWVKEVATETGQDEISFIPAFISASDPKKIEEVGARYSNIKIGEYSFDAVKFSLMNPELRISDELPQIDYPYIKRVRVETDRAMSAIDIYLNPDMNNLIGIRGSGKSALLEAIRYALELDAREDREYKDELLEKYAIGSGGKITLEILVSGQVYRIERIMGERPKVYRDDEYIPNLYPSSISHVVYYGQKDIQQQSMDREQQIELIDQFIGDKLQTIQEQTREKEDDIKDILKRLSDLKGKIKKKEEYKAKKASLEDKIAVFEKLQIADKLQKEADFKRDEVIFERLAEFTETSKDDISTFKEKIENHFSYIFPISSKENPDLFTELEKYLLALKAIWLEQIDEMEKVGTATFADLEILKDKFAEAKDSVEEEIAKIKREINTPDVSPDDFGRFVKELEQVQVAISEIEKYDRMTMELETTKQHLYSELQNLWYEQWSKRVQKKEEINASQTIIQLDIHYRGNKKSYAEFIKEMFRGTGLRGEKLDKLSNNFADNIELFNSLENRNNFQDIGFTDNEWLKFKERFFEQEEVLCLYRVPDLIEIRYDGKPIQKLSLGQRASSLLLLLLSQENTPVIMDQPEDDLDNQTVYEGLIKKVLELKGKRQIIFATHNPNIPVLGDCEQVVVFNNEDDKIVAESGSIDRSSIQKNIVDIMEGGKEAFTKRKEIYYQWIL
jgi:ABC-type Mn2+/Zn2+ transport system ATPase subunit